MCVLQPDGWWGWSTQKVFKPVVQSKQLVYDVVFDDILYCSLLYHYFDISTLGQNVQRFYTRTRQKYGLKAEQPKLWLCVCVCFFFFFFSGSTFWARTFKRIIFFLLCVVLPFAYALCDQFDAMIMPCDTFRECPHGTQSKLVSYTAGSMLSLSVEFRTHTNKIYLPC